MTELIFSIIFGLVGVCGTVYAIYTSAKTSKRAEKKDSEEEGRNDAAVMVELGYIKSGIETINRKMEKQEKDYVDIVIRVSACEKETSNLCNRLENHIGGRV